MNSLKTPRISVIIALICLVLAPRMCHAANYTRHTFKKTTYDKVWQACIDVRDKYAAKGHHKSTAAGKVTFETKADKEGGIIAFVTDEVIIASTQNTIKLKKYGKTAVMVLIRSVHHLILTPWDSDERDKETEKKLMGAIRGILEKKEAVE